MKRRLFVTLIVSFMLLAVTASVGAASQTTIGINSGYAFTWGELELEYKPGVMAYGMQVGYGWTVLEVSAFGRYYVPLNGYFNLSEEVGVNFFASVTPSVLINGTDSGLP
jgi:hypothetical protein